MKVVWQFIAVWSILLLGGYIVFKQITKPDFSHLSQAEREILARKLIHKAQKLPSENPTAIQALDSALLLNPNAAEAYLALAQRSISRKRSRKAQEHLHKAMILDTSAAIVFKAWLEMIHFKNYEKALQDYQLAIQVFKKDGLYLPEYYIHIGRAYRNLEEIDSAIVAFSTYLTEEKTDFIDPYVYAYRGLLHFLNKNMDAAFDDFQQTLLLWKKCPEAYYFLSKIYGERGENDLACQQIKKALLHQDYLKEDHYVDFLDMVTLEQLEGQFDKVCRSEK